MLELIIPSLESVVSLALIGLLFGIILAAARIKLKVEKDPRIEQVEEALPGANCGACGQPGCGGYARKIVLEGMDITLCPVGGDETIQKLAEIMGVEAQAGGIARIARVHCHGGEAETNRRFTYHGPADCRALNATMGGDKVCVYGCLGQGDCVSVCPFDAIYMGENGLPIVIDEKCTGCGNCVEICPRDIISLVSSDFDVYMLCLNEEKGAAMKKGCSVGCIACKLCEKACREQVFADNPDIDTAITVNNFIATIDYDLCINCYKCVEVCPAPCIHPVVKSKKYQKNLQKKREEEQKQKVVEEKEEKEEKVEA